MIGVRSVDNRGPEIVVRWHDDGTARFHATWLRDNCRCPTCRHPSTNELVLDQLLVPAELKVVEATALASGDLDLAWEDGHRTELPGAWLYEHRYDGPDHLGGEEWESDSSRDVCVWGPDTLPDLPRLAFADVMGDERGLLRLLDAVSRWGIAVVHDAPVVRDTIIDLVEAIAFVQPSNFGFTYDVTSRPDARSNAYTALALVVHTDLPHHDVPPAVQVLHCRENTVVGGESTFVDGCRVVDELRVRDPAALRTLFELPVAFRYVDEDADHRYVGRLVELDPRGGLRILRFAPNVVAPLQIAYERMPELRRAYQAFARVATDPALAVRYRLQPGDILVNDNHRILHGRGAFDPASGVRRLQGCYMEGAELRSRRRVLARRVA